jgi:hypothetical protein
MKGCEFWATTAIPFTPAGKAFADGFQTVAEAFPITNQCNIVGQKPQNLHLFLQ